MLEKIKIFYKQLLTFKGKYGGKHNANKSSSYVLNEDSTVKDVTLDNQDKPSIVNALRSKVIEEVKKAKQRKIRMALVQKKSSSNKKGSMVMRNPMDS